MEPSSKLAAAAGLAAALLATEARAGDKFSIDLFETGPAVVVPVISRLTPEGETALRAAMASAGLGAPRHFDGETRDGRLEWFEKQTRAYVSGFRDFKDGVAVPITSKFEGGFRLTMTPGEGGNAFAFTNTLFEGKSGEYDTLKTGGKTVQLPTTVQSRYGGTIPRDASVTAVVCRGAVLLVTRR